MEKKTQIVIMTVIVAVIVAACTVPPGGIGGVTAVPRTPAPASTPTPEISAELAELPEGWQWAELNGELVALSGVLVTSEATMGIAPFPSWEAAVAELGEVAGMIGVYALSAGEFVFKGVLLPLSVAHFGVTGGIHDMIYGPMDLTVNGQRIIVDRSMRTIEIIQLSAVDSDAVQDATEGREIEATPSSLTPTPEKRVALVDDESGITDVYPRIIVRRLEGLLFSTFPNCESLLAGMAQGQRFDAYIIDLRMGGGIRGDDCTAQVRAIHPEAVVYGHSSDPIDGELFMDAGAQGFILKEGGSYDQLGEMLKTLFFSQ